MRGPIDYIIVGFEGNNFNGEVLKSLKDAIDSGVIALVALSFITKDDAGQVTTLDIASVGDSYVSEFTQKYATESALVDPDDIDEMADLLENNTAAGLLVIEHLWAKPLKKALKDAGGVLVAEGRIHPESAEELELNRSEEK